MAGAQIGQRLAGSGGSFDQPSTALIQGVGNEFRHLGLLSARLSVMAHQCAAVMEHLGDSIGIEWPCGRLWLLRLGKRYDIRQSCALKLR